MQFYRPNLDEPPLDMYSVVTRLTQLETDDRAAIAAGYAEGADFGNMLSGYGFLLAAYAHLHALSPEDEARLYRASNQLWALGSYFEFGKIKDRAAYVDAAVAELRDSGEVLLASGYATHATVTRIRQEGGAYVMECYNAGNGSVEISSTQVRAVERFHLTLEDAEEAKAIIVSLVEQKFVEGDSLEFATLQAAIDRCKVSEAFDFKVAPPQAWGNCTTRSVREYLQDSLPEALFARVLTWIRTNGTGLAAHLTDGTDSRVPQDLAQRNDQLAEEIELAIGKLYRFGGYLPDVHIERIGNHGAMQDCFVHIGWAPLLMSVPLEGFIMTETDIRERFLPLLQESAREGEALSVLLGVHCELFPVMLKQDGRVDLSSVAFQTTTRDANGVFVEGSVETMSWEEFYVRRSVLTGSNLADEAEHSLVETLCNTSDLSIMPRPGRPEATFTLCATDQPMCALLSRHGLLMTPGTAMTCDHSQLRSVLDSIYAELEMLAPLNVLVDESVFLDAENKGNTPQCGVGDRGELYLTLTHPDMVCAIAEALEIKDPGPELRVSMEQMREISAGLYSQATQAVSLEEVQRSGRI
ncbi:MAG: hypothetical protein J0L97_03465 [Alphaproteobacteria bacterium]|nr:hypothetical protein [Alphaproteobacteria bacterium]